MGGVRDNTTEVVLEASCRRTGRCDGLRQTLLPYLCCFQLIMP
jgi:hypothetical protein